MKGERNQGYATNPWIPKAARFPRPAGAKIIIHTKSMQLLQSSFFLPLSNRIPWLLYGEVNFSSKKTLV